jgi:hypothetical protein
MKRILVIQPTEVVKIAELNYIKDNIVNSAKEGILILNKNMTYEIVEVDSLEIR